MGKIRTPEEGNTNENPAAIEPSKFKVVGVEPGPVRFGVPEIVTDQVWDLAEITEAEKELLFANGFPYLEKITQ